MHSRDHERTHMHIPTVYRLLARAPADLIPCRQHARQLPVRHRGAADELAGGLPHLSRRVESRLDVTTKRRDSGIMTHEIGASS